MIIIEIAGHLGADPESRVIPNGSKVTVLRVATNIRQGDKDDTIWWEVSIWGSEFDNMIKHLKKGSAVIVIGEMQQKLNIYNDKEGRPQIGYRMTGRMLKFSPFGKPDRPAQEGGYAASTSHAAAAPSHSGAQGSGPQGYGGGSTYGSNQNYAQPSYSNGAAEEEGPPF